MAEDDQSGELNLALLCFIAYRAMETRVLADLAAAGFDDVRRVPDPRDARARLVRIAERGLAAAAQFRHALTRLREITDPYG